VRSKEEFLLFFKHYDPANSLLFSLSLVNNLVSYFGFLRYVGRLFVECFGKPVGILAKLNYTAGFAPEEEIELFEASQIAYQEREIAHMLCLLHSGN